MDVRTLRGASANAVAVLTRDAFATGGEEHTSAFSSFVSHPNYGSVTLPEIGCLPKSFHVGATK
jgi:hypothetical protein